MRTVVKKKPENRHTLKDSMSPWDCHVVMQILVIFLIHQLGPVPERPISAKPGLKFCPVFVFYLLWHFMLSLL